MKQRDWKRKKGRRNRERGGWRVRKRERERERAFIKGIYLR